MTSLQKLYQQLASTSKSLKHGSQLVVSSMPIGISPRHDPKRSLSCQHRESLCLDVGDSSNLVQSTPSVLSRNVTSQSSHLCTISPIIRAKFDQFARNEDMVQRRKDMWEKSFEETSYFFHNGFRHVYPYNYTFHVFARNQWVDKTIEKALNSSFYAIHDENWVERDIADGCIRVNDLIPTKDYVLKKGDRIEHIIHRHEIPISDLKVDVLHYDSNVIAVNKPPSWPIHPTGRYQHNTLLYILAREYGMTDAHIIHRLDKGTSGVILFGRNKETARFFSMENANRKTSKTYIARVVGEFPKTIECDGALIPIDHRTRIMKVCKTGKPSKTVFELMNYNPKTNRSVVLCRPYTGRTHQIRVHLQYLGFPIDNDPIYNSMIFGEGKGKGGVSPKKGADVIRAYELTRSRWAPLEHATPSDIIYEPWLTMSKGPAVDHSKSFVDPECELCPLHLLIARDDFGFHLHALEFKGEGWSFSSPLPKWADPEWDDTDTVTTTANAFN